MKKLSVVSAISGAALLCMTPVSVHLSSIGSGSFGVSIGAAQAAELEIPAYQRAHRYRRYYRVAYYHPYCGGPYIGGGWNGGTYWGGPWMDLRCYGLPLY